MVLQERGELARFEDFSIFPRGGFDDDLLADLDAILEGTRPQETAIREIVTARPMGDRVHVGSFGGLLSAPKTQRLDAMRQPLTRLTGDNAVFCLAPGEVWSDAVNVDFSALPAEQRQRFGALFSHTATATAARPSEKWLKTAGKLVTEIGVEQLQESLQGWLSFVSQGQSVRRMGSWSGDTRGAANTMNDENANCLRGLLWLIPTLPQTSQFGRLITGVALSAYKKVPGVGPRAVKVGNAAVYALSQFHSQEAVGQLAMLKVRVKFRTAQKEIEKAFNVAAEALGLPRDQIEEMGVPSYGLDAGGVRHEMYGDYRAELVVTGSNAEARWFRCQRKAAQVSPGKSEAGPPRRLRGFPAIAQKHSRHAPGAARPDRRHVFAEKALAGCRLARALPGTSAGRHNRSALDLVRGRRTGPLH